MVFSFRSILINLIFNVILEIIYNFDENTLKFCADPWILYTSVYIFFYSNSWRIQRFSNGNEKRDGRVLNIYQQFARVSHLALIVVWFLARQILFNETKLE